MKVKLRNPDREVEVAGVRPVSAILDEIGIAVDTVLVIRAGELITRTSSPCSGPRSRRRSGASA